MRSTNSLRIHCLTWVSSLTTSGTGRRRVVLESSIAFDEAFPQYGTRHGVLPSDDAAMAVSPPLMWVDALELMMDRVAKSFQRASPNIGYGMTETNAYGPQNSGVDYIAHPTSTGTAPAAPPITMFWVDVRFNQSV